MITNERQYKITKAALDKLQESIKAVDLEKGRAAGSGEKLAKLQLDALESESEVLSDQLREYEALKSGAIADFRTESLDELPTLLVKARIAKGMSQRQLAERIGLKEQQIQRYSRACEQASLRRIIEVADALNLHVSKHARVDADVFTKSSRKTATPNWTRFPLREMYKRGWFPDFSGSLHEAQANADQLLPAFVSIAGQRWREALIANMYAVSFLLMITHCLLGNAVSYGFQRTNFGYGLESIAVNEQMDSRVA